MWAKSRITEMEIDTYYLPKSFQLNRFELSPEILNATECNNIHWFNVHK